MSEDILAAHLGADGILAGLRPDAVLVLCSTTTPTVLDEVRNGAGSGRHVVDAPIVGGVRYARERSVTFLVGGEPAPERGQSGCSSPWATWSVWVRPVRA